MQVAVDYPASVRSLVLVAGTPSFTRRPDWPHAVDPEVLEGFGRDLAQQYEQTLDRFVMLQVRGSERARELARSLRDRLARGTPPHTGVLEAGLRILRHTDLRPALGAIRCPVTALLGERDTLVPSEVSKDLHRLHPTWRIEVVAGAGHAPFLSHPDLFCDRILGVGHESA